MCRSIKTLYNYDPPATQEEVFLAARQFVRKLSGFRQPSKINEAVFNKAVEDITQTAQIMLHSLSTSAEPRVRLRESQ